MWKSQPKRSVQTEYVGDPVDGGLMHPSMGYDPEAWVSQPYENPQSTRGRALWDSPVYQIPYPVSEIVATNEQDMGHSVGEVAAESITRWTPWESEGVTPLPNGRQDQPSGHNIFGTANFFASDPSRGPGSCSAGAYMSTDWTHMVMGQPGSVMLGHQTFWGPYQPKPSLDFSPSTIYQPFPSYGTVAPKIA